MSRLETEFLTRLGDDWEKSTPGFKVQAYSKRKKIVDIEVGETFQYYDWASLTKLVFSTTRLMMLVDEKKFSVDSPVSKWIDWYPSAASSDAVSAKAKMRDLLSHSAALKWWYPFFKKLEPKTLPVGKAPLTPELAWYEFEKILRKQVLLDLEKQAVSQRKKVNSSLKQTKSVYSDLDFFLLGLAMCEITDQTLYDSFQVVRERLDLQDTDFHRGNVPKHDRLLYAPTEDCKWRKTVLQGEVHDENTWALRGVAPHAGLFGPIDDLSRWGLALRDAYLELQPKTSAFASSATVRLFTKRAIPAARGDWGLGFMLPTAGSASCGELFSAKSFGHTGFTGTSLWFDPVKDLLVVILANRIHPTRQNRGFSQLRPKIHTLIAEQLKES